MASKEETTSAPLLTENGEDANDNDAVIQIVDVFEEQVVTQSIIQNTQIKAVAPSDIEIQTKTAETDQMFDDNDIDNASSKATSITSLTHTNKMESYASLETDVSNDSQIVDSTKAGISTSFWNRYIVTRICLLLLCILLVTVNVIYSYGQLNEMYLKDFLCPHKSLQHIYQHSKSINMAGGTNEGCWSSKGININNGILFSDSNQPYDSEYNYTTNSMIKCVIFALLAVILFLALLYFHIYSFCIDIVRYFDGYYAKNHDNVENENDRCSFDCSCCCCSCAFIAKCLNALKVIVYEKIYQKLFADDYCAWITMLICGEIFEIVLQSIICLQYNGVYISFNLSNWYITVNKSGISLAEKREIVLLFAFLIVFNCIFTGLIWILYVVKHEKYHGKTFRYILCFIDSVFDLGYAVYPIIILLWNNNTLQAGASALHYDSWITFLGALYPMTAISYRLCWGIKDIINANHAYWTDDDDEREAVSDIEYQPLNEDIDYYINKKCCCYLMCNNKKVLDVNLVANRSKLNDVDDSFKIYNRQQTLRRVIIMLCGGICMLFGLIFMIFCLCHFYIYAPQVCNHPSAEILENHSELILWNKCIYKVYPFTFISSDTLNDIPCQCRILNIDLNHDEEEYADTVDSKVLDDVLKHYHMLQVLKIIGSRTTTFTLNFTSHPNMYYAPEIRVFDVEYININGLNDDIIAWSSNLEYLRIAYCQLSTFPSYIGMSSLSKLKYINLEYDLLTNIDLDWLCNMKDLKYLILNGNSFNVPFPSCIYEDLLSLTEIDISLNYASFHHKMFLLPNLNQFIAFGAADSNIPSFPMNDSFYYDQQTTYYLQGNIFCDQFLNNNNKTNLSSQLIAFLEDTNSCNPICPGITDVSEYLFCRPLSFQNGICDISCNIAACNYDGGDCNQLCDADCIESATMTDNFQCTQPCNYTECNWDFGACLNSDDYNYTDCLVNTQCQYEWIGDAICDEFCDVEVCNFDANDCQNCDEITAFVCYRASEWFLIFADVEDLIWYEAVICAHWDALISWTTDPMEGNCTEMVKYVDLDKSGYLNMYESLLAFVGFFQNDVQPKLFQMNCSLCAPNVASYYVPWSNAQIEYYTQHASEIAFQY